LMMYNS